MADFATLEEIYSNLAAIEPKFRKKLEGKREDAETFRKLTRLDTHRCTELDDEGLTPNPPDLQGLRDFFQEYEFRSLLRDLPRPAPRTVISGTEQASLFPHEHRRARNRPPGRAAGPDHRRPAGHGGEMCGTGSAGEGNDRGFRLGIGGDEWSLACPANGTDELVGRLAEAERVAVPSLKELYRTAPAWRELPLHLFFDLGLAAYLLNPEERGYSFDQVCRLFENAPETDPVHPSSMGLKAAAIAATLEKKIQVAEMDKLLADLEMPLIPVLADMENAGLAIDLDAFAAFLDEVQTQIDEHSARIIELAGQDFNIRSSQQIAEVLFTSWSSKPRARPLVARHPHPAPCWKN